MSETRVIGAQNRKIGGGQRPPAPAQAPAPEPSQAAPRRGRGRIVVVVLVVLLAVAAGAFFFLRPDSAAPAAPEAPEPGATVSVEPRNINLEGGHYLRLGFAVQLVADVEEIATAQATDIAIALFSGRTIEEVNDPVRRAELKGELTERLREAYDGEVLTVYLTDFVTQ